MVVAGGSYSWRSKKFRPECLTETTATSWFRLCVFRARGEQAG